ncbi:unnamed protein product [Prorocentrum cordatum]|uniref:Major facilitator superfamily (MFS) profile domain-containing protein n=1 Tax=Prorocentrum cordatum TaxID=2364126 RepID=A0ABN9TXD5_9DINO|nr:unnamed protein product [Polarella glacialis]
MVDALGGGESMRAILVSLVSVANCLGRVLFGVAPDALAVGAPRALFLAANLVLMGCAQLLLSLGSLPSLVAGAALAGFSYGGFWTLSPAMLAELFGRRWIATIYNSMSLAVSSASLVFSTVLASHFYDVQSGLHPAGGGAGCTGPTCYRLTHLIMASAAGAGLVSAAVLRDRARRRRGALSPEVDLADRAAAARC